MVRRTLFAGLGLLTTLVTTGAIANAFWTQPPFPPPPPDKPPTLPLPLPGAAKKQADSGASARIPVGLAPGLSSSESTLSTPLETLDWMVGDWVSTDAVGAAEFSCRFSDRNAFLVRSFRILTPKGMKMSGMQLIAWDPARKTIRSWTYDNNGGFGEDVWSQSKNRYTIRAKYTLPDGGAGSALHVMDYVNANTCKWRSINVEVDGELQPDLPEVTLVRKSRSGAETERN